MSQNFYDLLDDDEDDDQQSEEEADASEVKSESPPAEVKESFVASSSGRSERNEKEDSKEEESKRPIKGSYLSKQDMFLRLNKGKANMSQLSLKRATYEGQIKDCDQFLSQVREEKRQSLESAAS